MRSSGARQLIAGTVHVGVNPDRSELVGNCPTCGSRLTVEMRADGTFGRLVACMRCKEIYRVEADGSSTVSEEHPHGFAVSYGVEGEWNLPSIMEHLFDNVGPVNPVGGGFVCQPDENHTDFPTITVNEHARTVRFALFGDYTEREAGGIINQVVSEFGIKFQLDLHPLMLERWEHRDSAKGLVLVEQRPLGTLLRTRSKRQARA